MRPRKGALALLVSLVACLFLLESVMSRGRPETNQTAAARPVPGVLHLLLNDENWFPVVTPGAALVVLGFVVVARRRQVPTRAIITSGLNLFFGLWIAIMGTGHLFAVTTKIVLGILRPDIRPWVAISFGFAIAVAGWWLTVRIGRLTREDPRARKEAMWLNAWLILFLVIPAWPLVIPPLLNLLLLARQSKVAPPRVRALPGNERSATSQE